jgi:hypothetical protein
MVGDTVSGAKNLVTRPSVLRTAGTLVGGHIGGPLGAVVGREVASDLASSLNAPQVTKIPPPAPSVPSPPVAATPPPLPVEVAPAQPPPLPVPKGVDPKVWEKLSPELQEQLRLKTEGIEIQRSSNPAPQPPRDPSYYGVEPKPATPVTPEVTKIPFEPEREAAGAAKVTKAQAAVADKIGSALVKAGVTDELLEQISKSPEAEAMFRAKVGPLHAEDYVPSPETWKAVRDYVKRNKAEAPMPTHLQNNPKAAAAAIALGDLMKR